MSVWPVAFVGGLRYESPKVNAAGKVYGWKTVFDPHRPFAIDMAGFAVNLRLILQQPQAYFKLRGVKGGYQESSLLRELVTLNDLEPKASNCTKVQFPPGMGAGGGGEGINPRTCFCLGWFFISGPSSGLRTTGGFDLTLEIVGPNGEIFCSPAKRSTQVSVQKTMPSAALQARCCGALQGMQPNGTDRGALIADVSPQ